MQDFLADLARGLTNAAKMPSILNYVPNSETHQKFHSVGTVGRLLRGGNRSGKSVAGVVEGIWRATGKHPYQETHDVPTRGRVVTVDRDNGMLQIIMPLFKQWIPPSELVNGSWEDSFSKSDKVLTLRNGSTIDIKTHQQDIDSFAGVPLHWCWFDEECPQAIFNECRLRLIDFNGVWWMTMTPVEGQDWIFDRFIATNAKNVSTFEVNIRDNPHLNQQALALLEDDLDDDEKEVRQKGIFVPKGGRILREFDRQRHVIAPHSNIPISWAIYVSIDHGYNNPTAILWHAVSPNGKVVTFREHYMRRWVIKQHAERIREINKEIGREPNMYTGDPSMSQKNAITGTSALDEYRRHGVPIVPSTKDVMGGINKMNEYLKYDHWVITTDCPNSVREAFGYSFDIYHSPKIADRTNVQEKPKKKNDHCPDSMRYFFHFMPYLGPEVKGVPKTHSLTETNMQDFPWQVDPGLMRGLDLSDDDFAFGEIR